MNNKIELSDALNLFNEIDKAYNHEKPRLAARQAIMAIYDGIEDEYIDVVEETKELRGKDK